MKICDLCKSDQHIQSRLLYDDDVTPNEYDLCLKCRQEILKKVRKAIEDQHKDAMKKWS